MMVFIYIIGALVFALILTTGIFIFLRNLDKSHIEKLNRENKELRTKCIQNEVARMALVRQNEEKNAINKKLEIKLREINEKTFKDSLNDL